MRILIQITLMMIVTLTCSGFTWGKSGEQNCKDAKELVTNQHMKNPVSLPVDLENKVNKLCPGGVAQKYLEGMKFELGNEIDRAIPIYENIIQTDTQFPDAHGRLGLLHLARNNKPAAMVSLTKALEHGGTNPRYHFALAELLSETQAYPLALYYYEKSDALGRPHDVISLTGMARSYSGMKNWKEAEIPLRQALQLSPYNPALTSELARTVIRQQRLSEGIQLLKQAIALNPSDKSLHNQLADALNATGDIEASKAEAKLAGIVTGNAIATYIQEGDAYLLRRDFPAAISSYKNALEDKETPEVYQKLGDAYLAVGNDEDALRSYQKSISISPDDAGVHYSIGIILERKGDLGGAISEYEISISLDKNNGDAHRRLADIFVLKGNLTRAITEYKKILTSAPDNPVIHFSLARAYQKSGHVSDSIKSLETAIRLDPKNLEPRRELIKLEIRRKNLSNAEKQCREILAINRDDQQERLRLIAILGKQKQYDELVEFLTEESTRYPEDSTTFYRLGIVQEFLKDSPAAKHAFLHSIKIRPTAKVYHALARTYLRTSETKKAREALVEATKLEPKRQETKDLLELIDDEYGHVKTVHKRKSLVSKKKKHHHNSPKKKRSKKR